MRDFWKTLSRNRLALVGGVVVLFLAALAILTPVLAPWDPNRPDVKKILDPPSRTHLLGTDQLGRDVFSRFFLLLAVLAFLTPSIWTIMAVIGLTGWMGVTRLVRAEFLSLKEREFVVWSQNVGATGFRVIWRHILPNALAPVLVAMTLGIPAAILTESGLSFLGIGVPPPHATWGNILNEGKETIEIGWWLSVYPGLAILVTVLSYNLLGEGIRDALDPRLRQAGGRFVARSG